jgi:hypothetical protein
MVRTIQELVSDECPEEGSTPKSNQLLSELSHSIPNLPLYLAKLKSDLLS